MTNTVRAWSKDAGDAGVAGDVRAVRDPTIAARRRGRWWLAVLPLLCASAAIADPEPAPSARVDSITGTVEIKQLATKNRPGERTLRVYLPPDYAKDDRRRFPVLYLQDGQNVFSGLTSFLPNQEWRADEAAESMIEAGLIEPLVIVAIDNAGAQRGDEYLPFKVKYPDGSEEGGEADAYSRMVIDEIKPFIDRTYRTKRDAANTALAGSSYGAIVSLYMGLRSPGVFGKIALVSPSLWWDDGVMLKQVEALPGKRDQRYWIDLGTSEGATMRPADARALGKLFEKKGWKPGKDLVVYIDGFAIHREDAWARRFPLILMFLFARRPA